MRCCERIEAGSIADLRDRTAGRVADKLATLAGTLAASHEQMLLAEAATRFQGLVRSRNNLLHAKPGTDHDGKQRLFRDGDAWSVAEINGIAAAFTECGAAFDRALNGYLREGADLSRRK